VRFISIWKANRLAHGGASYGGGTAIRAKAQSLNFRPGDILIEDVLVASEADLWAVKTVPRSIWNHLLILQAAAMN